MEARHLVVILRHRMRSDLLVHSAGSNYILGTSGCR